MSPIRRPQLLLTILLSLPPVFGVSQVTSVSSPIDLAQKQITTYLSNLADLHCTESVTQEKLAPNGHSEATARAKYDYLIMMNGTGDDFQLNESRIEATTDHPKSQSKPMLISNGMATVLLVFHPYYRDSFKFEVGAVEPVDGRPAIPVHFTHKTGQRTPAVLALRGREFPLELEGTAWLDQASGEVVKIDAGLLRDMTDVGLRSFSVHVEYKPAKVGKQVSSMDLPAVAVVDVTTPLQHWRNTHQFGDYKSFSTNTEQNPDVKIHEETVASDSSGNQTGVNQSPKEKP